MSFAPAPLVLEDVLNIKWLSSALSQGRAPVEITGFNVIETLGPSALKIRLALEFAGARPVDIPEQICIKGVFNPELKAWLSSGAQQAEANFYRFVAPASSVRVPKSLYAGYDPETMAGLVVMEDLIPLGVHFLSALSPYSIEQTHQSLDQLARLHGGTWNRDAKQEPWVTSKLGFLAGAPTVSPTRLTELMLGERGDALPADIRDGERIYAAITALDQQTQAAVDQCYIHGDAHAGNVWEGPDGVGLVDWQTLQRGQWALDVAYHMAAALDVEDRRRSEKMLLAYYLERLAAHGGTPPNEERAWDLYSSAVAYGLLMWGMTLRVEPPIIKQFVTRLGTAVVDNGAFERLGV